MAPGRVEPEAGATSGDATSVAPWSVIERLILLDAVSACGLHDLAGVVDVMQRAASEIRRAPHAGRWARPPSSFTAAALAATYAQLLADAPGGRGGTDSERHAALRAALCENCELWRKYLHGLSSLLGTPAKLRT